MISAKRIQLSLMMFLQFFIWGAWYVTAPNYLSGIGFTGNDFGWTYAVGPIAGMLTPFFVGMVADRFFAAQRLMGILHLAGAALMFLAATFMNSGETPNTINIVFFGYMMTYYPTLSLSNAIAMRHMRDPKKEFPFIRVFGTIGWIAAGLSLSWLAWETTIDMFHLCAGASAALGLFSFFLPDTSPESRDEKISIGQMFGIDAMLLLKDRSYLVFLVSSILICIPLAFYYQLASRVVEMANLPIALTMSYGQMSEILFMLVMPLFFARLGIKWMLVLGMSCWVLRYVFFAFGASSHTAWMILFGIVIHGICYDFFFVTGQIYTDKIAPKKIRAQAQGLLVFFTLGLGMFVGAKVAGHLEATYTPPESVAFKAAGQDVASAITALENNTEMNAAKIAILTEEKNALRMKELQSLNWKRIWGIPAIMAACVMSFFIIFFKDPEKEPLKPSDTNLHVE